MYKSISTSMLRVGAVLRSPLYDERNVMLLNEGLEITERLLDRLRERRIGSVAVHIRDIARLTAFQSKGCGREALDGRPNLRAAAENTLTRSLDQQVESGQDLALVVSGEPFARRVKQREAARYDNDAMNHFADAHHQVVEQLDHSFAALVSGESLNTEMMAGIVQERLIAAAEDLDLFVCLGINPLSESYPGQHSLHVAMLALAIGTDLGLDERLLIELGLGCLVHDAGMLRIRSDSYQVKRVLEPAEFVEITKHPIFTFELLSEKVEEIPAGARMVAYQMHERLDGSGYPRGRTAEQIHELAKIAAVADAYVALVSPRPHRRGMLPYAAITRMLHDVKAGLFDARVVRALLNTVSLFPVGSFVRLSDERVGKVIRSNGECYDRPVVEVWPPHGVNAEPDVIDLSAERDLRVVAPLTGLE